MNAFNNMNYLYIICSVPLLCFFTQCYSQRPYLGTLGASVEYKAKYDEYTYTVQPFPDSEKYCYYRMSERDFGYFFDYYYHRFAVETGICRQTFYVGWDQKDVMAVHYSIDRFKLVPVRLSYSFPLFQIFKRPLKLSPGIGYVFASGKPITFAWGTNDIITVGNITLLQYTRLGEELGLAHKFGLWEGRLQIEYPVFSFFSLYGGIGYCKGSGTIIARYFGIYTISNGPENEVRTESNGTHRFWNLGIRLKIPDKKTDKKKSRVPLINK